MSISSKLDKLATDITNAYGAINTKGGTIPSNKNTENLANAITSIPQGGGGGLEEKDVNFYDYDGTLVNSYTKNEFLALTELPENPTHAGLTSQGWNWSLADAKAFVNTYNEILDIGQMYITDDGKTRVYITLNDINYLSPYLGIGINGTATVEWGDGTSSTITGTNINTTSYAQHTYSSIGNYIIKISSTSNINLRGTSNGSNLLSNQDRSITYQNVITKVEIGTNIKFISYTFSYCTNLKFITIPNYITNLPQYIFNHCYSLKIIIVPSTATSVSTPVYNTYNLEIVSLPKGITTFSAGYNLCYKLKRITIPKGISGTLSGIGSGCHLVKKLVIPEGITSLGTYFMGDMTNLEEIKLPSTLTTIPNNSNAFFGAGKVKEITIPNSVTTLYLNSTFNNNYLLQKINMTIPNSTTEIGSSCFSSCYSLKSFTIPSQITTIGSSAFYNCYSLSDLQILGDITSIAGYAFYNCGSVKTFNFSNCTTVPTLANISAFNNTTGTIVVPDSLYSTWIAATNWSSLASRIVKASEV